MWLPGPWTDSPRKSIKRRRGKADSESRKYRCVENKEMS
jgi:hypothetical protein